ncbi:hypothetical protein F8M41_019101 [Gigaspora margarita]|uniref:Uncharacterized protein n=1 Tax=Gigaspora margarita TaxID=4874 RepID=A0A8H4EKS0_GIGMA|nr:hypothetical protein F8M41_019101 [Gigaspora margarita]
MGEKVHLARSSSAAPSYYVVESDYFKVQNADTTAKEEEVNPGDESEETQKSDDETDEGEENLEVYKDAETYESEVDTIVGSDVEG